MSVLLNKLQTKMIIFFTLLGIVVAVFIMVVSNNFKYMYFNQVGLSIYQHTYNFQSFVYLMFVSFSLQYNKQEKKKEDEFVDFSYYFQKFSFCFVCLLQRFLYFLSLFSLQRESKVKYKNNFKGQKCHYPLYFNRTWVNTKSSYTFT